MALKGPDRGKSGLELGDQVGVGHHLEVQPRLLPEVHFDPEVIHDDAAHRADRRSQDHEGRGAFDRDVGVAQRVLFGDLRHHRQ